MSVVVVDASAMAAILFGEPAAEEVMERLDGSDLAAPSLLPYELANVAGGKVRRGASTDAVIAGLEIFAAMHVVLHGPDALSVFRLAIRSGLTAYDAAYLWLARSLSADLVTLDAKLERAAARIR